jgi:hypothetical protein
MRTAFHNRSSNTPFSLPVLALHRVLLARQASSLNHTAKARVRVCMASSTSRPMKNLSWVITRMHTVIRTS